MIAEIYFAPHFHATQNYLLRQMMIEEMVLALCRWQWDLQVAPIFCHFENSAVAKQAGSGNPSHDLKKPYSKVQMKMKEEV